MVYHTSNSLKVFKYVSFTNDEGGLNDNKMYDAHIYMYTPHKRDKG